METMKWAAAFAGAMLLACGTGQAEDHDWEDIFAPYRERIDTATTSSGNAHNVNAATQVITPWPRNVLNRRIPGDGARMVGAVKAYREPHAQPDTVSSPAARSLAPALPTGGGQAGASDAAKAGTAASEQSEQ